jgi:hypothetical protein
MLTFELHLTNEARQTAVLLGAVRNIGTTPHPRLHCQLDAVGPAPVLFGVCEAPFAWSTPIADLCEQAIAAALARDRGRKLNVLERIGTAELRVLASQHELLSWTCWRMYEELEDEDGFWPSLGRARLTPWELARRMLQRAKSSPRARFKSMAPPEKRMPPVYRARGQAYCRSQDLPPSLRETFERMHCLSPQPAVAGVGDAFFPHDTQRFLAFRWWMAGALEDDCDTAARSA